MPADSARYLGGAVSAQPTIHRWYAWPHLVSPHTAAFNFRERIVPAMRSYLKAPKVHQAALRNPDRYGGPFLDAGARDPQVVAELLARVEREGRPLLEFADAVDTARKLLAQQATGGQLAPLYPQLPPPLRGRVELCYDLADRPALRFFEAMLYRSELYDRSAQEFSLLAKPDLAQPFTFNSPVLPAADRVDLAVPFDSPVLDELFAARTAPADVGALAERLGLSGAEATAFAGLFTETPPSRREPVGTGVRMRFFGHACVLLETAGSSVLLDPLIGYTDDGYRHFTFADLPERIDAVVLSHAHPDHVSVETLTQLRHRVDTVYVPADSGGSLADPGLRPFLLALGFPRVEALTELDTRRAGTDLEITALPFLGEHGDLDIRSKMVPLVTLGGRRFVFATDMTLAAPELFEQLAPAIGPVDALFVGLECVGAPMSWLYGPLLEERPGREADDSRSLRGSDARMADALARLVSAGHVYAYAMGFEPWLRHLTGSAYDPESEQAKQTALLIEACGRRGVPAELLHLQAERLWT